MVDFGFSMGEENVLVYPSLAVIRDHVLQIITFDLPFHSFVEYMRSCEVEKTHVMIL